MAANFNKWIGCGRLVKDPRTSTTESGHTVVRFTVAMSRKVGEREDTSYVPCEAWGKLGEACEKYLTKGSPVLVEGWLNVRSYKDKADEWKTFVAINCAAVQFLGQSDGGGGSSGTREASKAKDSSDDEWGDMPF